MCTVSPVETEVEEVPTVSPAIGVESLHLTSDRIMQKREGHFLVIWMQGSDLMHHKPDAMVTSERYLFFCE